MPPTFDFATRGGEFIPYISQISWGKSHKSFKYISPRMLTSFILDGVLRPKIVSVIEYLKSSGVKKIGVIGFCW